MGGDAAQWPRAFAKCGEARAAETERVGHELVGRRPKRRYANMWRYVAMPGAVVMLLCMLFNQSCFSKPCVEGPLTAREDFTDRWSNVPPQCDAGARAALPSPLPPPHNVATRTMQLPCPACMPAPGCP